MSPRRAYSRQLSFDRASLGLFLRVLDSGTVY